MSMCQIAVKLANAWFVSLCLGPNRECHSYPLSFSFTFSWPARSIPGVESPPCLVLMTYRR